MLLSCAFFTGRAQAQEPERPFSQIALYAGGSAQVGSNALSEYYHSSPGVDAVLTTPFYAGVAGIDLGLRRYETRLPGRRTEDLWAAPVVLRWGVRLPTGARRLRVEPAVRVGGLFMRFSGGTAGLRNESELLVGADVDASLQLGEHWALLAGVRYERVFMSTPVHLWQARAGVRRRLDAPQWLQTFLR